MPTKHAALQKVDVVRGEDGISVEITARGQVTPKLTALDRPARVVIDLPNTVAADRAKPHRRGQRQA